MSARYYVDPSTGEPRIYSHEVDEHEVEDVLGRLVAYELGPEALRALRRRRRKNA